MNNTALVFPGQGSQYIGMGKDLYDNFSIAREIFEKASDKLSIDMKKLCFESEDVHLTVNAQPAILTVSTAAYEVLKSERTIDPSDTLSLFNCPLKSFIIISSVFSFTFDNSIFS